MLEKLYIPLNTQKHRKKAWLEYWSRHINLIKKQETELHSGYVTIRKILSHFEKLKFQYWRKKRKKLIIYLPVISFF